MDHYEYYAQPAVRRRLWEYIADVHGEPTSHYLVGYGRELLRQGNDRPFESASVEELGDILDNRLDVFRSVWDRQSTLFILDIEYYNRDHPERVYLCSHDVFVALEPLYHQVRSLLSDYGIDHMSIMTGQGYHFVTRVPFQSWAHHHLERLASVPDTLLGKYAHLAPGTRRRERVTMTAAAGFEAMGRLLGFFTQEIIRRTAAHVSLPLQVSDVAVGPREHGREAISIDTTMYGDPLFMRDIRLPFSTHQKHKVQSYKVGKAVSEGTPIQITLPRATNSGEIGLWAALKMRRDFAAAAEYAAVQCCAIPDGQQGVARLIDAYEQSELARFDRELDATPQDPWPDWPNTYDRTDLDQLPPCVALPLRNPNPALLQPTNLQTIVRCLLGRGWHPAHVAGLVRSRYERGHGWEEDWSKYDANSRARYWVRTYAGLLATGVDGLVDHNCISHWEKGHCPAPNCGFRLTDERPWR
ncbi:MAG: hypothetical protein HYV63_16135 [Candidatus Schekmanbacteria bacterium]|nr:hypothetical protein [Candidatus Schekmanbacteria bacterium]